MNTWRSDFPWFENNPKGIYFDNSSSALTLRYVIDGIVEYYSKYSCNVHRGEYPNSLICENRIHDCRKEIQKLINAKNSNSIIFTSGTTMSINNLSQLILDKVNKNDVILLSEQEHSSNIIPWIEIANKKGAKVEYINSSLEKITLEKLISSFSNHVKIVSLAHIANTLGYLNDLEEIGNFLEDKNCLFFVDAAQSIPHIKVDVEKLKCDALYFSGHKMYGPTGIGVLYLGEKLINLKPVIFGGGMNTLIKKNSWEPKTEAPFRFEAGTLNISAIFGLYEAAKYLNNTDWSRIEKQEKELISYFLKKAKKCPKMVLYNDNPDVPIFIFNITKHFAQDVCEEMSLNNIFLRSGEHCAKLIKKDNENLITIRASLAFYNTTSEIDKLFSCIESSSDFLSALFQ